MKKIIPLLLALVIISVTVGCGSSGGSYLLQEGKLLVGTDIEYPPFEMYEADGQTLVGLDIELGLAIGEIMGLEVEFIDTGFDGILDGLKNKKYDAVMAAITITASRAEEVDFSSPYVENWQAIVIIKGGEPITSMKGLGGKRVAYQKGAASKDYISIFIDKGELTCYETEYPKIAECFDDLRDGRVDAVLCDSVVADKFAADEPDVFEVSWTQENEPGETPELFGIAVRKGNAGLLDRINDALRQMEDDGGLDGLRDKWLAIY